MPSIIKSSLLILALGITGAFAAQPKPKGAVTTPTANFSFDDNNGPADAGYYPAGTSFTVAVNLSFAPGGNISNLIGLSYWFEQQSPLAPFYFSITNRDATGSLFTDLQTPHPAYPQKLTPTNSSDLGALNPTLTGFGAGNYFIANITFAIDPATPPGTYILEDATVAPKKSIIADDQGRTFPISLTTYTVNVVALKVTSITQTMDQHIVLQCQGVPNGVNRIEASPDLSANSFQTVASPVADASGMFSFEDSNPGTQRFYRIAFP